MADESTALAGRPGADQPAQARFVKMEPVDGVTTLADSFTRPQNRICFQSAPLESLKLQVIGITVGQQFGWSEATSGTGLAIATKIPGFR
jgi:hypothetical protein